MSFFKVSLFTRYSNFLKSHFFNRNVLKHIFLGPLLLLASLWKLTDIDSKNYTFTANNSFYYLYRLFQIVVAAILIKELTPWGVILFQTMDLVSHYLETILIWLIYFIADLITGFFSILVEDKLYDIGYIIFDVISYPVFFIISVYTVTAILLGCMFVLFKLPQQIRSSDLSAVMSFLYQSLALLVIFLGLFYFPVELTPTQEFTLGGLMLGVIYFNISSKDWFFGATLIFFFIIADILHIGNTVTEEEQPIAKVSYQTDIYSQNGYTLQPAVLDSSYKGYAQEVRSRVPIGRGARGSAKPSKPSIKGSKMSTRISSAFQTKTQAVSKKIKAAPKAIGQAFGKGMQPVRKLVKGNKAVKKEAQRNAKAQEKRNADFKKEQQTKAREQAKRNADFKKQQQNTSNHAAKRMGQRSVPQSSIDYAIKNGKKVQSTKDPLAVEYHISGGGKKGQAGLVVVVNKKTGKVITVIKKSHSYIVP